MDRASVRAARIKTALMVGFGLTFGVWLVAGYYFAARISYTGILSAAIDTRYMRAQELLSTVRAQVLSGSVYARDALLDPNPTSTNDYRLRLEESYGAVERALEDRLTMLRVLRTDSTRWPVEAPGLLRTQIVPKLETVIRVSEEVQALNRLAFVQQQRDLAEIYIVIQRQLWQSLGLALAGSLGIALVAALYAGRLKDRLQRQRVREAQHARDLQHLSAKLITAQEEERRSIARELHDEVGQVLTAIQVELAAAQRAIEASGGSANLLSDARCIADGALTTVRDLSHLLHPALLDDLGLPAAVEWYLRGFGKRYGIRTEVLRDHMDERLAREVETSAYRIVQEALTNVAKHAQANTCRVYLQRLRNTVLITVEDDGAGFDSAELGRADAHVGLGLLGIRGRAVELGGTVRLESSAGTGTRLTVELPARPRVRFDDCSAADQRRPEIDSIPRAVLYG